MTMQRFTEKSQEALVAAQRRAEDSHQARSMCFTCSPSWPSRKAASCRWSSAAQAPTPVLVANQVRRELERLPKAYGSVEVSLLTQPS